MALTEEGRRREHAARLRAMRLNPEDKRHGLTGYGYGCRCLRCKAGKRAANDVSNQRRLQREAHQRLILDLSKRRPYVDPFTFDKHREAWAELDSDTSFRFFLNNIHPEQLSRDEMWLYMQALNEGKVA